MMRYKVFRSAIYAAILVAASFAHAGEENGSVSVDGKVVRIGRQVFTIAPSGLPAQIQIQAAPNELPLEMRGPKAKPDAGTLAIIGRGDQLRTPLRIQISDGGQVMEGKAEKPATPVLGEDGRVAAEATLRAGKATLQVKSVYAPAGQMHITVIPAAGAKAEMLEVVLDLKGMVDTIIPGTPVSEKTTVLPAKNYALTDEEGVVWGNAEKDAQAGGISAPGTLKRIFIGNGDRGFTLLTDGANWVADPAVSTHVLERDKAGNLTWRIRLVNKAGTLPTKPLGFTLIVHPAAMRGNDARKVAWLTWKKAAPTSVNTAEAVKPDTVVRADSVSYADGRGAGAVLSGPAGGDALSPEKDIAACYPMPLWRYLSGSFTSLPARVLPNSGTLIQPGMDPAPDRAVLGRALLHDIGVDPAGLAHLAEARTFVSALQAFGYFETDGMTECIPYWRSKGLVRYGEVFQKDNQFELTKEDPNARVYVTVYRRPRAKPQKGIKALFIVVNENPYPVRNRLFVLQPQRLFGKENVVTVGSIRKGYDYSHFPPTSDWDHGRGPLGMRNDPGALMDVMDKGVVIKQKSKLRKSEIYGPLYIPAHGYRLLTGFSNK